MTTDRITIGGLCALVGALVPPLTGRVETLPPTGATCDVQLLKDGRAGVCIQVDGLPRCTVLDVEIYDSGDPPLHVWTIHVQKFLEAGNTLTAEILADQSRLA